MRKITYFTSIQRPQLSMVMVATAIGLALLLAYPFLAGAEDTALTLHDGCNGGACDPNNPDSIDGGPGPATTEVELGDPDT